MGTHDELEGIAASWRSDLAAAERRRRRTLLAHGAQSATFAAVAADLIEQGVPVSLTTIAGQRHVGALQALGEDFLAIADRAGKTTYVALDAVVALLVTGAAGRAPDARAIGPRRSLAALLGDLATEQPRVTLRAHDGDVLAGRLLDVGLDLVRLRLDDAAQTIAYVALWSLAEASVTGSG
jgi:hypothetical protein